MLMSETNETLFSAYKKRQRREEKAAVEMAKREPVEKADEAEVADEADEPSPQTPYLADRIPAMEEIASQYEQDVYDQYSRKVVAGRTVVKKPGKKVEMSKTRLKYLERKNKSLQTEPAMPGDEKFVNNSPMPVDVSTRGVISRDVDPASYKTPETRVGQSPRPPVMGEPWLSTIHDERQVFSTKFVARPPKRYKHVGSRLKDPNYYLKKDQNSRLPSEEIFTNDQNDMVSRRSQSELRKANKHVANKGHFDQKIQKLEITRSAENTRTVGVSSVPEAYRSPRRQQGGTAYSKLYRRQTMEKMYYTMWRTAFTNALEKLRENKLRQILLQTPDLIAEQDEKSRQLQKKPPSKLNPVKRMSVVKPTLNAGAQKPLRETPEPVKRSANVAVSNQGSYTQRFRKMAGFESPRNSLALPEVDKGKHSTQQQKPVPPMNLIEHRTDVITKSGLNRLLNVNI